MHIPNQNKLDDIEKSIELISPVQALADSGMHSGVHTTITKFLVAMSVALLAISFVIPSFGALALAVFCLAIPVCLLGEVLASIRSGEFRVSLSAWRVIRNIDVIEHKYPRVVIRRTERPLRFWFYQVLFVLFGLSPFLIAGFVYFRS
jgi:hypothetical protein